VKFKRLSPPEVPISRYKLPHAAVPSVRLGPLEATDNAYLTILSSLAASYII